MQQSTQTHFHPPDTALSISPQTKTGSESVDNDAAARSTVLPSFQQSEMKAELNARFLTCWPLCASAGPSLPPSYCATLVNQKWRSKWTPDALQLQNMQHVATTSCANWHVQLWITTSHVFQSTENLLLPAWTKSWSGFSELTFQRNTGSQGWVSLCSIGATRKKDLAG